MTNRDWRENMERRLASYATYEKDWWTEGYGSCGAIPFAPETLSNTRTVLCDLVDHFPKTATDATPVPLMEGQILLEWDEFAFSIVTDVCEVWYPEAIECDLKLPEDMPRLRELFAQHAR